MRIGLLSSLALALCAGVSLQAQASGDDSCYPDWRVSQDSLTACSNMPFLSPGNDSRTNLRLLLAAKKNAPLTPMHWAKMTWPRALARSRSRCIAWCPALPRAGA